MPPRLHGLRLGRASSFCAYGSRSCGLFRTGSWLLVPGSWLLASWVAGEASAVLKVSNPGALQKASNYVNSLLYQYLSLHRFWTFPPFCTFSPPAGLSARRIDCNAFFGKGLPRFRAPAALRGPRCRPRTAMEMFSVSARAFLG